MVVALRLLIPTTQTRLDPLAGIWRSIDRFSPPLVLNLTLFNGITPLAMTDLLARGRAFVFPLPPSVKNAGVNSLATIALASADLFTITRRLITPFVPLVNSDRTTYFPQ